MVAAQVGFLTVALPLWLDHGRLTDPLSSLVPLRIGILWTLGGTELPGLVAIRGALGTSLVAITRLPAFFRLRRR